MKLQIKKLFLVRRETHEFKTYDFETNKLNVIVGQSARGKTTVWAIVDYVCCSRECDIDRDIIDAVEWVGIMFETVHGNYAVAREVKTELKTASSRFYLKHLESDAENFCDLNICHNSSKDAVKSVLDRICGIEAMVNATNEEGKSIPFSIRHLLKIVGQDYPTISNQKYLFANLDTHQWQAIIKYFPSAVGVNADMLNSLRNEKKTNDKKLKELKEEYNKATRISKEWARQLHDQLLTAKSLTMIPAGVEISNTTEKCLALVRNLLAKYEDSPIESFDVEILGDLAEHIRKCERKKSDLEFKISEIQVRIHELESLEGKADAIHAEAVKAKDRLEIGKWMIANWGDYNIDMFSYPYATGRGADEVRNEIALLGRKLERYEKTVLDNKNIREFRNLKKIELQNLKKQQEDLAESIRCINNEIRLLKEKGVSERERISRYQDVNRQAMELIGSFKRTIELIEGLADTGDLMRKIQECELLIKGNEESITREKALVESRLGDFINEISVRTFEIAKGIGLADSFNFAHIRFDPSVLDFRLTTPENDTYLKDRKSTANHIPFHIGVTAAIEEYCVKNEASLMPDFVIYDQPTQGRSGVEKDINVGEQCFLNIVRELAGSVEKSGYGWQPILIDSWGADTLNKIREDYNLVADLDYLGGLVPSEWMK